MQAIRRTNTKPEVLVRSELHRRGYRFRKDFGLRLADKLVRPDVAFTKVRLAVFIDGCFWHCCPEHGRQPRANVNYWSPKLRRNVERDQLQSQLLAEHDWTVLRIWEHEPISAALARITDVLARLRGAGE